MVDDIEHREIEILWGLSGDLLAARLGAKGVDAKMISLSLGLPFPLRI